MAKVYIQVLIIIVLSGCSGCWNKPVSSDILKEDIEEVGDFDSLGRKQGIWKYYKNGELIMKETYRNDTLHGIGIAFFSNGKPYNRVVFEKGVMRSFKSWYKNGIKNSVSYYNEFGSQDSIFKIWHENGNLFQIGYHWEGKGFDDTMKYFYESGALKELRVYDRGDKVGKWVYFNEDGDTIKTVVYSNGNRIDSTIYE